MENQYGVKFWSVLSVGVFAIIVAIGFAFSTFETIEAGERGVVLRWGNYDGTLGTGFHMINPISTDIIVMDVRVRKFETEASAASKDLQIVKSVIALNAHADPDGVGWIFENVGVGYVDRILSPAIQESVKAGTALFTAEELISKREMVKEEIRAKLVERLAAFRVIVDDFSIIDFKFSAEFDAAIESKQTAEQRALEAENDLRRIEVEAQQRIAEAKAEAEAIRIQAQAITQQGGADYVKLKAIESWNGVLPTYMMDGAMPFINIK